MLTLNDGRSELWQWDTGRKLAVDADCSQVHFSNKVFGRSIDMDVVDGTAAIPDVLLQVDNELIAWAFVGTPENGYTKISKVFKVNKRNKPADYVFTPPEQTTLGQIMKRLDQIEESQDPDAIKNAVYDYLANNPIQIDEKDPTVPAWAKQATKPKYTATEVGAVATVNGVKPDANGNVEITIQGSGGDVDQSGLTTVQIEAIHNMFKVCAFVKDDISAEYNAFMTAFGITDSGEEEPDVPDVPDIPDEPHEPEVPEVTLTSISATYSGGEVAVGTDVSALTGIVVTAHYSDGSAKNVSGYTLSGTIAEGSNTVTVTYEGMSTTFTVTGIAEATDEYTLHWNVDVSKFLNGYGVTQGASGSPPYTMKNSNRTVYPYFDIPANYGETYKFEWEFESGSARFGVEFYNQQWMDAVAANQDANKNWLQDCGWDATSPVEKTPTDQNCRTLRLMLDSGTAVLKSVTIYKKRAS